MTEQTTLERLARRLTESDGWSSFFGKDEATVLVEDLLTELMEPGKKQMAAIAKAVHDAVGQGDLVDRDGFINTDALARAYMAGHQAMLQAILDEADNSGGG